MKEQYRWLGESGESYTYTVHDWPALLSAVPGNYMIARQYPKTGWFPFLIGETADLSALLDDQRVRLLAQHAPCHIHVRASLDSDAQRRCEVQDLVRRWMPPGNEPSVASILAGVGSRL